MPSALIEIEHLSYHFQDDEAALRPALEDVNLTIREGEWVALLGANGSGKTTLVRQLNALLLPTSGQVRINGMDTRDRRNRPQIRATIGMVFQNPEDQIVAGIVEEDAAFGPENLAVAPAEIRRRVDEALEQVGLSQHSLRPPHLLSAGQKQRLAIAGVLAMRPRCIIFDEATTMLDPVGRRSVLEIMRRLHAAGMTILFITHFMEEAANAERLVVLNKGRLVADDSPAVIFSQPVRLAEWDLEQPPAAAVAESLRQSISKFPSAIYSASDLQAALLSLPHGEVTLSPASQAGATTAAPIIQVDDLAHVYMLDTPLAHQALTSVSLEIPEGSGYALLGATGSGKSTLLQHLNGLLRPQKGSVRVGPYLLNDPKIKTRDVVALAGLVFQNPENQFFEQYVGDEIAYGPRQFTSDEPLAQRVRRAMELVGLDFEAFKDRLTFTLSGGERRKVALASILALSPRILLLDEPLAGLDPAARRTTLNRLGNLRLQTGATLVLSSHQMEDVVALARDAVVLHQGRSVMQDCLACIFNRPAELAATGLEPPLAARLAADLRSHGWPIPADVLTPAQLVTAVLTAWRAAR